MDKKPKGPGKIGTYMSIAQVGVEMVILIPVGVWLDDHFNTQPWLTLAGIALGFFGGIAHLLFLGKQAEKEQKDEQNQRTGASGP